MCSPRSFTPPSCSHFASMFKFGFIQFLFREIEMITFVPLSFSLCVCVCVVHLFAFF